MLRVFLFSSFFLFQLLGRTQHSIPTEEKYTCKSVLYLEGGGVGLYGSLNYEHLLFHADKNKVMLRVGGMAYPDQSGDHFPGTGLFALGTYYLKGERHHLEMGLNTCWGYGFYEKKTMMIAVAPSIGYRLHNFESRSLFFSIAFTPMIGNWEGIGSVFIPSGKLGIGYVFNRRRSQR